MTTNPNYKRYYKEFSQNVAFAVRTWHHHVYLNKRAKDDKKVLDALNKAPRYWIDQRYAAVQTTIIFLGKIFDENSQAFNIDKMLKAAYDEKAHFSKEKLRERKIAITGEFKGLDEYISKATALDHDELRVLSAQIKKAKSIWEKIKPLRHQVFAHNDVLTDAEQETLHANVKNSDITDTLQILLNVSEALFQAEINGRKPNFAHDVTYPINHAHDNMEKLIQSLL